MFKIQIRFNTQHAGGPLLWRVLINGVEHLASEVQAMGVGFKTTSDQITVGNIEEEKEAEVVIKQHITVLTPSKPVWNGSVVFIN